MYRDLRSQYYWSRMKRDVGDFVQRCITCQQVNAEHQKLTGLLQPLEVAKWKWEHVIMDYVTHLSRTQRRHDVVWIIVDLLTKSAHFLAVRMTFTLEEFCRLYIFVRLSSYIECQSLSYRTGILGLQCTFGRVSKSPWGHS